MKDIKNRANMLIVGLIITGFLFLPLSPFFNKAQASIYSPFGGQIEEYIEDSDAECVEDLAGEINNILQKIVRGIVNPIITPIAATLSATGPWGVIAAAALLAAVNGIIEGIKIVGVEEIKIGPPREATVGILNIGVISFKILGVTIFHLNVASVTGLFKVYEHEKIKEDVWVLGTSLDVLELCEKVGAEAICDNEVVKVIFDGLNEIKEEAEAAEEAGDTDTANEKWEYLSECPLLNLLHRIGTGPEPISIP